MSVIDRHLVERVAGALATDEGLVEKDWQVVRAIGVLASLDQGDVTAVFSGGTSLLKGWGLIKRFSEDIDFKVAMPTVQSDTASRKQRRAYRVRVLSALASNGFSQVGDPLIGNESRFFSASLAYQSLFTPGRGLRPHIRVEMSFHAPARVPIRRPIQSLIALAQKQLPEVPSFPCVDPLETAADKLSTLAWRVCSRERGGAYDDPTIIRHLHDLAALEGYLKGLLGFSELVLKTAADDTGRGGATVPKGHSERFATMLNILDGDKRWASEYESFVLQVSFAKPGETISFAEALAATRRLVKTAGASADENAKYDEMELAKQSMPNDDRA
ncbi:MAG: nucleotidyl transferase AbiEii/AbiGii toxin family protein [Deltaproteobacteria bacterium]|nr:nucleotidyl transferase AbiEii/AbiGii toxin family protein [Deltaproteobacteria bacterium]